MMKLVKGTEGTPTHVVSDNEDQLESKQKTAISW